MLFISAAHSRLFTKLTENFHIGHVCAEGKNQSLKRALGLVLTGLFIFSLLCANRSLSVTVGYHRPEESRQRGE